MNEPRDIATRLRQAHRHLERTSRAGFTLIEVLLAVMLLATLTAITWVGVSNMFDTRDYMTERFERYQIMRVAMDRMARELASAYVAGPDHGAEELPGEPDQPQQQEDQQSTQQQLREPIQLGMIGRDDELNFTAFAHIRSIEGEKASQHAEIGYFIERRRNEEGELVKYLMRREDVTADDDITDGGKIYTMVPNVEEVKFEFWDPGPVEVGTMEEMAEEGKWEDSWDTTKSEYAGRLPTRIRVTVELPALDELGRKETFTIQTHVGATEVLEF